MLQLRRVTFWTKTDPELQEFTDSEGEDEDEAEDEKVNEEYTTVATGKS